MYGKFTIATNVGRRDYQEDRAVTATTQQGTLLAVFDGHGSEATSELLSGKVVSAFLDAEEAAGEKARLAERPLDYKEVLRITFETLATATNHLNPGSTATVVFIPKDQSTAFIAVLGDSPVIARMTGGTLHVSPEHNARSNKAEREAAEKRGGVYAGGYMCKRWNGPGIQMTRAFGDTELSGVISREPEIYQIPLGRWLIVATDGLEDPGHTQGGQLTEAIAALVDDPSTIAQDLVNLALAIPTGDNVTAILWRYSSE
jgi:serine/threonine protein phosphatase PrpC